MMMKTDENYKASPDLYPSPRISSCRISRCQSKQGWQRDGLKSQLELSRIRNRGSLWEMTQKVMPNRHMEYSW